jgi:hypothetical protein
MNVLREWRGAIHGAAVVSSGLDPLAAVMVRTPAMAGLFGWPEPYPDPAPYEADWTGAEAATNKTVGRAFATLEAPDRAQLVELMLATQKGAT